MKKNVLFCILGLLVGGCVTINSEGKAIQSPGGNALASLFIPGAGQWCVGETGKGWGHFSLWMGTNIFYLASARTKTVQTGPFTFVSWTDYDETYLYVGLGIGIISAIDAWNSSNRFNLGLAPARDGATVSMTWRY